MKSILAIDDDIQMRQMLERERYEVVDALDGTEGLKFYRQAPADLIITDIIMLEKAGVPRLDLAVKCQCFS